ncbi:MAG: hypothetical protein MJZ34_02465 [Paludibacteraceae bacterium]|nr:hypothetical protein [Paludibacteraceae bacterium]
MIYLKSDGTETCHALVELYKNELIALGDSVFNTGENVKEISDTNITKTRGSTVIDFTFMHNLLKDKIKDINRVNCFSKIEPVADYISSMAQGMEYCILVPNFDQNDSASVRSKVINELRMGGVGKLRITKQESFTNTHRSNPYMFKLNNRNVSLLSLDKMITDKLKTCFDKGENNG